MILTTYKSWDDPPSKAPRNSIRPAKKKKESGGDFFAKLPGSSGWVTQNWWFIRDLFSGVGLRLGDEVGSRLEEAGG